MNVGRGIGYLFTEIGVALFSGYFFWFFISKFTTSDVIGIAAAVVSTASIFITISSMSIPNGVQRFLASSFSEHKGGNTRLLFNAALLLTSLGISASAAFIFILKDWISDSFGIDFNLILIAVLLITASCISNLFRSIVIASLRTKMLPVIMIISTAVKITLAIALILIGTGAVGVAVGFTSFEIVTSILLAMNLMIILRSHEKPDIGFKESVKNILSASVVSWIPALLIALGSHLGTIVVFSSSGSGQAGVYFIAFSGVSAISVLMLAPLSMAYPKLSAMKDRRKRFASRMTKISLTAFWPFSASIIFYSEEILGLFGPEYARGSFDFQILLLSLFPTMMISGVRTLAYAYGNYRQVLAIGIGMSVPRIMLYFILVPVYGSTGASLSFTVGAIIGFCVSVIITRVIKMELHWKDLILILLIPTSLSFVLSYIGIYYILGILAIISVSFVLFVRLNVLTRSDVEDSMGVFPSKIANRTLHLLNILAKKINSSY